MVTVFFSYFAIFYVFARAILCYNFINKMRRKI